MRPKTIFLILIFAIFLIFLLLFFYSYIGIKKAETAYPPQGKFIKVGNTRLHYVVRGEGKPVVFLPGVFGTTYDFTLSPTIPLVEKEFQCIIFDRPGHGYSDPLPKNAYPWIQAKLIREALQQLGINKPILVGHSWGTAVALSYALDYPNDVTGLVLLGGVAYDWTGGVDSIFYIPEIPILGKLFVHTLLVPIGKNMAPKMAASAFFPDQVSQEFARASRSLAMRPTQYETDSEEMRIIQESLRLMSPRYPELKLPIYLLAGDSDQNVSTAHHSYQFARTNFSSVLKVLPKTGHVVHFTQPEEVFQAIKSMGDKT